MIMQRDSLANAMLIFFMCDDPAMAEDVASMLEDLGRKQEADILRDPNAKWEVTQDMVVVRVS